MSNERPIEPRSAADQPPLLGGHDFLDLEGELARRRGGSDEAEPAPEGSWLLEGQEPAPPQVSPAAPIVEHLPEAPVPEHLPEAPIVEHLPEAPIVEHLPEAPIVEHLPEAPIQTVPETPAEAESHWLLEFEDGEAGTHGLALLPGEATPLAPTPPITLEASYCEPEPTSRAVSRAARRGAAVMGFAILAVAGVQLSRQGAGLGDAPDLRQPVELEQPLSRETVLASPERSGRGGVGRSARGRLEQPASVNLRPAEPGELTTWEEFIGDDDTDKPFDLDVPASVSVDAPREDSQALIDEGRQIDRDLTELQAGAELESDVEPPSRALPAPSDGLLAELRDHAPALAPMATLGGPAFARAWMLRHPDLAPRRDAPPLVWIEPVDLLPIQAERLGEPTPDWTVAEATEKPAVPVAPLPDPVLFAEFLAQAPADVAEPTFAIVEPFAEAETISAEIELAPAPEPVVEAPVAPMPPREHAPQDGPAVAFAETEPAPFESEPCEGGCTRWCDLDQQGRWYLGDPVDPAVDAVVDREALVTEPEMDVPVSDLVALEPVEERVVELTDLEDPNAIAGPMLDPVPALIQDPASEKTGPRPQSRLLASRRNLFELYGDYLRTGEVPADAHAPLPGGVQEPAPPTGAEVTGVASTTYPEVGPAVAGVTPAGDAPPIEAPTVAAAPAPEEPERAGALRRASSAGRWDGVEVPDEATLRGSQRVLTPNVGDVRASFSSGSVLTGKLHAVGAGKIWLDTTTGRVSFESHRVVSIQLDGQRSLSSGRVCVTTAGGVFVGELLSHEGQKVTLLTDDGLTLTVTSDDVRPEKDQRQRVGIRRQSD